MVTLAKQVRTWNEVWQTARIKKKTSKKIYVYKILTTKLYR
jgi:hypothetical protein